MASRIEDLEMEPANNGHKICYYEYKKREGADDFSPMISNKVELVFSDEEFDKAIEKYKELTEMVRKSS